jgi:peptide chain release factor 2
MDTERIKEIEAAMEQPDFWQNPAEAQALIKELQDLKTEAEGGSAYDRGSAIITVVAGAGGDDAEDFARMLYDMYRAYVEKTRLERARVACQRKRPRRLSQPLDGD